MIPRDRREIRVIPAAPPGVAEVAERSHGLASLDLRLGASGLAPTRLARPGTGCDNAQLAYIVDSEPAEDMEWNRLAVCAAGDGHSG
jgi:hypothetical protein